MKRLLVTTLFLFVALGMWGQNWSLDPTYGSVDLEWDFQPDPFRRSITAGGSSNLTQLGYYGYVAEAPDFSLNYTAGRYALTIKVEDTSADTVLLVNGPNGSWHFNDDTNGLDPAITFNSPSGGRYDIWIGTFDGNFADSTLVITELD